MVEEESIQPKKKDHSYSRAIFKQIERKRIETYTSTPHTHAIKKRTNNQTKGKENENQIGFFLFFF